VALELSAVEEAQARRKKGNDRSGAVDLGWERGGRPRLVVIFKEARELGLEIQSRLQVLTHGPSGGRGFARAACRT
jgi:hypothetical protein